MAGLDNVPQQQQITIETAKIDADILNSINDYNQKIQSLIVKNIHKVESIFKMELFSTNLAHQLENNWLRCKDNNLNNLNKLCQMVLVD